jgi:3-oxoacyl-[acyl-carrier protein] reductase
VFTRIAELYKGSTAIVVGAGGIGGAIIQLLADSAARIVVADRDQALLDRLTATGQSGKIVVRKLDVGDSSAVTEFFAFIKTTVGAPDFLFYTAGILNTEPLSKTTSEIWDRAVNVNLNGAFYCAQGAAELMRPQRRGSILLLGSISGTRARSGSRVNPVYNATKAGIAAFVNAAAIQLRKYGVRINSISPGPTETAMMEIQPPQVLAAVSEITLDGRMNSPSEVAEVALFVAAHGRFTGEDIGFGGGAGLGG